VLLLLSWWICLTGSARAAGKEDDQRSPTEFTAVPIVGGDSDVGFGGGYILSYARLPGVYEPYLFRIESAGAITFKRESGQQGWQIPYLDDYVMLHLPHAIPRRLEVELRLSFTREANLKFYGLGNAARIPDGADPTAQYFEHLRIHPTARWRSIYHLTGSFQLVWGLAYTHNWLDVPPDTLLEQQMRSASSDVRRLLGTPRNHGVVQFSYGVRWDSRDNEVDPNRGQFHDLRIDLAPSGVSGMPYEWARLVTAARGYVPLVADRLTGAVRVAADLLFGEAPFYELPRFDDTFAIGGANGVRGVPAQRYYGKIKLFGNAELRSKLFDFDFWGKTNSFGVTGFFDAGRLWADYRSLPELDGTGLGLKYGTGGGIRLTAGDSFVLRADVAWSPDANPIGAYLTSGHIF
jgi:hypothetical protein